MFYAYFDESGDPKDINPKVFTLACFIASEKQWGKWDTSWRRILRRFKVNALHMRDFEHRKREFKGWSQIRADSFISQLAGITKMTLRYGLSMSLRMDHWQAFIKPNMAEPYEERRGPYIFLLQACLWKIVTEATYLPKADRIACFFEENIYVQAAAKSHYALLKQKYKWGDTLLEASFEPKSAFMPFQVADMLAYEGRKSLINNVESRKPRKLALSLRASTRISFMELDLEALIDTAFQAEQRGVLL